MHYLNMRIHLHGFLQVTLILIMSLNLCRGHWKNGLETAKKTYFKNYLKKIFQGHVEITNPWYFKERQKLII